MCSFLRSFKVLVVTSITGVYTPKQSTIPNIYVDGKQLKMLMSLDSTLTFKKTH